MDQAFHLTCGGQYRVRHIGNPIEEDSLEKSRQGFETSPGDVGMYNLTLDQIHCSGGELDWFCEGQALIKE